LQSNTLGASSLVDAFKQVELLGATDWRERSTALHTLSQAGPAALDAIIGGTIHPNWRVRRGCADLMDHLADARCTASLISLLRDPIASVRRLAVHALSCQGCKQCPLDIDIVAHLNEVVASDTSIRVRRVAVHQIGCQPPDDRAIATLRDLIRTETDRGILSRAQWALMQHDSKVVPAHPNEESRTQESANRYTQEQVL